MIARNNEIKLKDENAKKTSNNESSSNLNNFLGMDSCPSGKTSTRGGEN